MTEPPIPKLENESLKWYSRFLLYVGLPVAERSLLAAYKAEKAPESPVSAPSSWKRAFHVYRWQERADLFDQRELDLESKKLIEARRRESKRRFSLLRKTRKALEKILTQLSTPQGLGRWSPGDFLRGLAVLVGADREEHPAVTLSGELETADDYCRKIRVSMSTGYLAGFGQGLPEELDRDEAGDDATE